MIIPTAQWEKTNPWIPNTRGQMRAAAAFKLALQTPDARIAIVGGYPNHAGFTLADRLAAWIQPLFDWHQLALVQGGGNRTIDDMVLVSRELDLVWPHSHTETQAIFCSELPHYARCEPTLRELGYQPGFLASGADWSLYSGKELSWSFKATREDALGTSPTAQHWRKEADRFALNHQLFCQRWAKKHEELDRQSLYETQVRLKKLQDAKVAIHSSKIL